MCSPSSRVACVAARTWCRASYVALFRCPNWLLYGILRKLVRPACPKSFMLPPKLQGAQWVLYLFLTGGRGQMHLLFFFLLWKRYVTVPQITGSLEILLRWQASEFLWKLPRTCMHLSYPEWLLLLASQETWSTASSCYYQPNESGWCTIERQSRSLGTRFWYKAEELIHFQGKTVRYSVGLTNWKHTVTDAPY